MAYGIKYKFIIDSLNGAEVEIDVLKDGYSGSATQRPLGSAPVLRQQRNDRVSGSSLAFTPECQVDGEYTEFYTTDPFQYKVNLYRAGTLIWTGFITPELYSEPDIAPPYDVNVTATDGLGELRRYTFQPMGKVTLQALFINHLSHTGQSRDLNYISRLSYSGVSYSAFFIDTYLNLDYKAGENCYDVLQYLLTTFNAVISYYNGSWLISRENDITLSSGGIRLNVVADDSWDLPVLEGWSIVPGQTSALLEWQADKQASGQWNLRWGAVNGMTSHTSSVGSGYSYLFEGLEPGQAYFCELWFTQWDKTGRVYRMEFRALNRLTDYPLIGGLDRTWRVGDRFRLFLLNPAQDQTGVSWRIDNESCTEEYYSFNRTGTFRIQATITYSDGSKETLTKILEVKDAE